jgi:protease-4
MIRACFAMALAACVLLCSGCIKPKITIFPETTEPLKERTLQGCGDRKILIIPVKGFISDSQKWRVLYHTPSVVQEVVSELKKAEKDKDIKAVIVKIDSPGGTVTASDLLYHEIMEYKERTGVKVGAAMMDVAASGAYYIALAADYILAHPTTITGSIGVVFLRPNVSGLMDKIGLRMDVDKSGRNKDMGSPFRKATKHEEQILQNIIDQMAGRFLSLAASRRKLSDEAQREIHSARVYTASDALRLGLVDQVGYLDDAIRKMEEMAGLPKDAKVVIYRRAKYPDDNLYNTSMSKPGVPEINLINLGLAESIPAFRSGFYYLWLPDLSN